jgi:hypothetical protein
MENLMSASEPRYRLDFSNHACRIRIEGTKPGKDIKVLVRDQRDATGPLLHGTGVLSNDQSTFSATFANAEGEQTLACNWLELRSELARYPKYD